MSFERSIFSIAGLPPEVLAVAMAKYSRSGASIKETIDELTEEKSAEFHEKWVLGFGDASVADMAVIPMALENISILASKVVEDCRMASFQEKSTRYQPFHIDRFFVPEELADPAMRALYVEGIRDLMEGYQTITEAMVAFYQKTYAKPAEMSDKAYANKCCARALDVARYLLPTATLTNFGMIMNARELRHCISKLLAHPLLEMHSIGKELQHAATTAAYNPQFNKIQPLLERLLGSTSEPHLIQELRQQLTLQVKGAPTLVKHTDPKQYLMEKSKNMRQWTERLLSGVTSPESRIPEPRVDYISGQITPEDELIATLLYAESTLPFRTIVETVRPLPLETKQDILDSVQNKRGSHDWVSREFEVGQGLLFDTLFDYGAFRDLQRHRITSQINQGVSTLHGYEIPRDIEDAGLLDRYTQFMQRNRARVETLRSTVGYASQYLIALGWKKRTLFKMNLRELYHMVELRTKSGGHFSYRDLCYEMFEKVKAIHPLLVRDLRAVKMNFPREFFER
ncbi:FAD-dependent thymidylate synthase [Candidatus Uhrbacteria bacterium]|nr:FAD-dependent thymidylate synthase [Candidatus Uhrbacteria bacterium]